LNSGLWKWRSKELLVDYPHVPEHASLVFFAIEDVRHQYFFSPQRHGNAQRCYDEHGSNRESRADRALAAFFTPIMWFPPQLSDNAGRLRRALLYSTVNSRDT